MQGQLPVQSGMLFLSHFGTYAFPDHVSCRPNILELDTLLTELSLCSKRTELYFTFLARKIGVGDCQNKRICVFVLLFVCCCMHVCLYVLVCIVVCVLYACVFVRVVVCMCACVCCCLCVYLHVCDFVQKH